VHVGGLPAPLLYVSPIRSTWSRHSASPAAKPPGWKFVMAIR
jgi:hypothetical protein